MLPVTAAARAVASGKRDAFFSDATVAGTPARVLTERAPEGGVWQVALPLSDVNSTLTHLKLVLAIVCLGGIALAAALGLLVSRAALVPVRRLTGAAERIARTQDLGHRIEAGEEHELGRLAASFNTMLAALERSRLAQRQLMSDASHELRTPLTSAQANLDALALGGQLPRARARPRNRGRASTAARAHGARRRPGRPVQDRGRGDRDRGRAPRSRRQPERSSAQDGMRGRACARSPSTPSPAWCAPRPRAWTARSRTCWTTRANGTRPRRPPARSKCGCAMGAWKCETTGQGSPPRTCRACSTASTARPRRVGVPALASGWRSSGRQPRLTAAAVHAANDPGGGARLTLELPPLEMSDAELRDRSQTARRSPPPQITPLARGPLPFRKFLDSCKEIFRLGPV